MSSAAAASVAPAAAPVAQKPLPFAYQFVAGAIAGVSEITVMYPLDVVKTRFQLQVGKAGADGYTSIMDCFRKVIKQEGISKLYRGIAAPVLVEAPKRAIKFAANDQYSHLYMSLFNEAKMTQPLSILTGVSAGCTEAMAIVPFELVKVRMQDKANAGKYKNTGDAIMKIWKEERLVGFFKGLEATVWRHGVWNGAYFGVIHGIRSALPEAKTPEGNTLRNFVAGALGGTFATTLNTPFDLVKTRVQNQLPGAAAKYGWTLPACVTIAKEEGIAALYKGYVPKVLRLGPGGGILLVVFEQVTSLMRQYLM